MYANMSQDFLNTYSHAKMEEALKETRERTLSREALAHLKAQKRINMPGQAIPAFNWLTFIRQHI